MAGDSTWRDLLSPRPFEPSHGSFHLLTLQLCLPRLSWHATAPFAPLTPVFWPDFKLEDYYLLPAPTPFEREEFILLNLFKMFYSNTLF